MHAIVTLARRESCHLQTENLTYFPTWTPFISFSSLIAMARTSKTMLNSHGRVGTFALSSDFRGNAFSFLPLRITLALGLLWPLLC